MNRRDLIAMIGATASTKLAPLSGSLLIENQHTRVDADMSFSTGIECLDEEIGRVGPGDVLTVAGHRLSGKTSFVLTIANHISGIHGKDVIYWGPHINLDPDLAGALRTLGGNREGKLRLRCTHEPLDRKRINGDRLGALIIDDFDEQASFHDIDWYKNEGLIIRKLEELVRFAEEMECLVVTVVTIDVEADWPREPPLPPWHDILDLGLMGREAQKVGKIAMLSRPRIYLPDCDFFLENNTSIGLPKQCCHPVDRGDPIVILDNNTGMFRAMTRDESRRLCSGRVQYEIA